MTFSRPTITKRQNVAPVEEKDIFTDELSITDSVRLQNDEDFFKNAARLVQQASEGDHVQAVARVSFNSTRAFLNVMTPKRHDLLKMVKEKGRFESIELLAVELKRDRGTVSRDVKALADAGLILVRDVVLRGHGRRSEITPVAQKITVELSM